MTWVSRLVGLVVVACGLVIVTAPIASAHAELVSSVPAAGDVLETAPAKVDLVFSEDVLASTVAVAVVPEGRDPIPVTDFAVDGSALTLAWPSAVTTGAVAVNYRVVSADGHPISGSVEFRIGAPTPSTAEPVGELAAEPAEPAEPVVAPVVAISVGLAIGIGVGLVVLLRRRSRP